MSFLSAIKNFFVGAPATKIEEDAGMQAPYKISEPAATTPIPLVTEISPGFAMPIEAAPVVAAKKTPITKKPAAKAPRKPRAPKA